MIDEEFDADEVLRDMDAKGELFIEEEVKSNDDDDDDDEEMRELNFGTSYDENANFSDMASELDNAEDLWE